MLLRIRGQGHVVGFKNNKLILWSQKRIITAPKYQKWMQQAVASFVFQLLSGSAIVAGEIPPACSKLSWISSLLPVDDSVKDLPVGSWTVLRVPKGEEGADILIEELTTTSSTT